MMNRYCVVYVKYEDVEFAPRRNVHIIRECDVERFKHDCALKHIVIEKIEYFETTTILTTKE